jgi:hypothetical protein
VAEELLQFQRECGVIEQASFRVEVDDEIDVAALVVGTASDLPEQTDISGAMFCRNGENLIAVRCHDLGSSHDFSCAAETNPIADRFCRIRSASKRLSSNCGAKASRFTVYSPRG